MFPILCICISYKHISSIYSCISCIHVSWNRKLEAEDMGIMGIKDLKEMCFRTHWAKSTAFLVRKLKWSLTLQYHHDLGKHPDQEKEFRLSQLEEH